MHAHLRSGSRPAPAPARRDPRRALGALGEQLAARHLRRGGYALLARNVRTRQGEIDLIAYDGHTLVFAEVKTRRATGGRAIRPDQEPLAALRPRQRARLRRSAAAWLREGGSRPAARAIRFDAIGVVVDAHGRLLRLTHLPGAW